MSKKQIRIGTRGSRLALWQAQHVQQRLLSAHPELDVVLVVVKTKGDRDTSTPLPQLGGTGVFTKEIEQALLRQECDVAVHSLKDLPTQLLPGFFLAAVLERADPRDVIVTRSGCPLEQLPKNSLVGSSSLRRRSQILHQRPDLRFCDIRGNVQTRLRAVGVALTEGNAPKSETMDATLLALAGLRRLQLDQYVSQIVSPQVLLPAPGQAAVAVEVLEDEAATRQLIAGLEHAETRTLTDAERVFLRVFEGGCKVPIGALAQMVDGVIELEGVVADPDGSRLYRAKVSGIDAETVGAQLADKLSAMGARQILLDLKKQGVQ